MNSPIFDPRSTRVLINNIARFLAPALVPLLVIASWELAMRAGWLPSSILAKPTQVLLSAVKLAADGALFRHAWFSLRRLFLGFLAGMIPAFCAGTLIGYSRLAERLFAPTIALIAPIPVTAWIPLLIIVAGVDEASKSAVIAIGAFFPIYFGTFNGIRGVDPKLVEVARIYEKSPLKTLTHVLLPSALDSIFLGMRSALALAWVLLIVAEVIASSDGIGWLMWDARNFARPADMIVGMITAGLLGALTMSVLSHLQQLLLFWKPRFKGAE
jgi:sulfonate transport system permease protein